MDIPRIVRSQYHAALAMLGAAIEACPDEIWDRPEDHNRTWQVACHTLFFTHLYLQPTEADFTPWAKHRGDMTALGGRRPEPPHDLINPGEPLPKADVLEYLEFCRAQVDAIVPTLDWEAPSGFDWLPFDKLETQLYSLRHIMQHVGELYERAAKTTGAELRWVGRQT